LERTYFPDFGVKFAKVRIWPFWAYFGPFWGILGHFADFSAQNERNVPSKLNSAFELGKMGRDIY